MKYSKMIVALVGAVCTWAVTYFPHNHTVQVAVGLATALVTVATVYLVPNQAGKPSGDKGYALIELCFALLVIVLIIWVLLHVLT